MRAIVITVSILLSACGVRVPVECHGACDEPDGTPCNADCDCASGKCLGSFCEQPVAPTTSCSGETDPVCGSGTCSADRCEGQTCATTEDCPGFESCEGSACVLHLCI